MENACMHAVLVQSFSDPHAIGNDIESSFCKILSSNGHERKQIWRQTRLVCTANGTVVVIRFPHGNRRVPSSFGRTF